VDKDKLGQDELSWVRFSVRLGLGPDSKAQLDQDHKENSIIVS